MTTLKEVAKAVPKAGKWQRYDEIDFLFDKLGVPLNARKGSSLTRSLAVAVLDFAIVNTKKLDKLMKEMRRGRADLFNLALGHKSHSFTVWTYMGMAIAVSYSNFYSCLLTSPI